MDDDFLAGRATKANLDAFADSVIADLERREPNLHSNVELFSLWSDLLDCKAETMTDEHARLVRLGIELGTSIHFVEQPSVAFCR